MLEEKFFGKFQKNNETLDNKKTDSSSTSAGVELELNKNDTEEQLDFDTQDLIILENLIDRKNEICRKVKNNEKLTFFEQKIYDKRFEIENKYGIEKILQESDISRLYQFRMGLEELVRRKKVNSEELTKIESKIYRRIPVEMKNFDGRKSLNMDIEELAGIFLMDEQLIGRYESRQRDLIDKVSIPQGDFSIVSISSGEETIFESKPFSEDSFPGASLDYSRFRGQFNINANVISFVDQNGCVWVGWYSENALESIKNAGYSKGGFGVPYDGVWMRENFDRYLSKTEQTAYPNLLKKWEPVREWNENKEDPEYLEALTFEGFYKIFTKVNKTTQEELIGKSQQELFKFYGEFVNSNSEERGLVLNKFKDLDLKQLSVEEFRKFIYLLDDESFLFLMERINTDILSQLSSVEFRNLFIRNKQSAAILLEKINDETLNSIFEKIKISELRIFLKLIGNEKFKKVLISRIDFEIYLHDETTDAESLDFLINVISYNDDSENGIKKQAFEWIKEENKYPIIFREKGALLLIGFGVDINKLANKEIDFFAKTFYSTKKTKIEIDNLALNDSCLELAKKENMSVGRYFSLLISAQQNQIKEPSKSLQEIFYFIVNEQEKISNEPFFKGNNFLPIVHEEGDEGQGFWSSEDSFSLDPFLKIAESSGMSISQGATRFDNQKMKKEQILELIKTAPEETTLFMGTHGKKDKLILSENNNIFISIEEFIKSVSSAKEISQIVFLSCYSDYNADKILKEWPKEKEPPLILSSSNFNSPTIKLTLDAWYYFAFKIVPKIQSRGEVPVWNDYWKYLEGRLMVLGDEKNSADPTIHISKNKKEFII